MKTFYNGVAHAMRSMIDTATGFTLMSKIKDHPYNLIEDMVLNNYQWSNKRGQPKWVGAKSDVDVLTLLTGKMNAMT